MRLNTAIIVVVTFVASALFAPLHAEPAKPAEPVEIPLNPLPFVLKGALRSPEGEGPFPAVLLLPACGRFAGSVDQEWAQALSSWGYVTLTLDVFTARGIVGNTTCLFVVPPDLAEDVYRGLNLLAVRKDVDPKHVFVAGFGRAGSLVFAAIERDGIEHTARRKFKAAIAFYPPCGDVKGVMTVATLVVVGARDQGVLDGCRKMAEGEDDAGISRNPGAGAPIHLAIITDAYFGFDLPAFETPVDADGRHIEYSKAAVDQAKEIVRRFLQSQLEQRP
jgi:dienelactone hydrolase